MRLVFTGIPASGAWIMRGEQLAAARPGWRAAPDATAADLRGADAVVVVKSATDATLAAIRASGAPLIYDALDFWPQGRRLDGRPNPYLALRDAGAARSLVEPTVARLRPDLLICPTEAMRDDLAPLGWPTATLHHHADPRFTPAPPRGDRPLRVLYHGHRGFLRGWGPWLKVLSRARGAAFVTSMEIPPPPADAVVAVRGGRHGAWISRRWKSNLKAASAMRLGLPFVAWPESGYVETCPTGLWFTTPAELWRALGAALSGPRPAPETERFTPAWCAARLEGLIEAHLR